MIIPILQVGQLRQRREGGKHKENKSHLGPQKQNTKLSSEAQEFAFLMPLLPTPA